jgi:hypothetical protein
LRHRAQAVASLTVDALLLLRFNVMAATAAVAIVAVLAHGGSA